MVGLDGRRFGCPILGTQAFPLFSVSKAKGMNRKPHWLWLSAVVPLVVIVYLATRPPFRTPSTLDGFRLECKGDEACAQKKWADWQFNMDNTIDMLTEWAVARQDAARSPVSER
jgi:hypothetical protein